MATDRGRLNAAAGAGHREPVFPAGLITPLARFTDPAPDRSLRPQWLATAGHLATQLFHLGRGHTGRLDRRRTCLVEQVPASDPVGLRGSPS